MFNTSISFKSSNEISSISLLLIYFNRKCHSPLTLQGYHGILCGACDKTHGKVRSGECQKCRGSTVNVIMAGLLATVLISLAAVMMKDALCIVPHQAQDGPCFASTSTVYRSPLFVSDGNRGGHRVAEGSMEGPPQEVLLVEDGNQGGQWVAEGSMEGPPQEVVVAEGRVSLGKAVKKEKKIYTHEIFKVRLDDYNLLNNRRKKEECFLEGIAGVKFLFSYVFPEFVVIY